MLAHRRAVFVAACAAIAVHLVADALIATEPGVGALDNWLAAVVPVALVAAGTLAFQRLRAGAQATLAATLSLLAAVAAGTSVAHASMDGLDLVDVTGFVLVPAAIALAWLAGALLWTSRRPEGRWIVRRTLIGIAAFVVALEIVAPIGFAWVVTHRPAGETAPADLGRAYEEVRVPAPDGFELSAWYVPPRNGAVVITFPSREGTADHARLLSDNGYGVLALDARGYGESDGDPNALGWGSAADIDAAVDFLERRPEIRAGCVGGLGLSVGGEQMIEAAAGNDGLAAVVSEGAGERSVRETLIFGAEAALTIPFQAVLTGAAAVFSGDAPPGALDGLAAEIPPRPLLLIYGEDGQGGEELNRDYFEAAGEPAELWRAPGGHTGALDADPAEYERLVIGFFDGALGRCA